MSRNGWTARPRQPDAHRKPASPTVTRAGPPRHRSCPSDFSKTVRLELYLRDIYFADAAQAMLRETFGQDGPAVAIIGADLESPLEVKLNAIAI